MQSLQQQQTAQSSNWTPAVDRLQSQAQLSLRVDDNDGRDSTQPTQYRPWGQWTAPPTLSYSIRRLCIAVWKGWLSDVLANMCRQRKLSLSQYYQPTSTVLLILWTIWLLDFQTIIVTLLDTQKNRKHSSGNMVVMYQSDESCYLPTIK